ncbi:MAG: histidinol-phosphate aminotransferase family protein [Spirochaetales bacterium]|jgi:histidinol-phosphate aminotransferase|nr:histidinol-phosphate aminotransferase family protein [Exilispira sp.]NMC67235.1 histidinol-phosphate aminotransferase family protein [Spirochaetales bacterium]
MSKRFFRKNLTKKSENKIYVERKKTTLALNESSISTISLLSDFEKEKILNARIEKYPTSDFITPFLTSLKEYCKVNSEQQILIANGIDELLYFLFIAINEKNAKCIVNVPTYPDYKNYGESVGLSFIEIPLIENFDSNVEYNIDIKRLVKKGKRKDVKAIIFTNPNNPTGTLFPLADIIYVMQKLKDKLIIIDEAYIEFCLDKTMIPLLNEFENLVILRTFSKGFLSPGLRLGYLVSNEHITSQLKKVFPVFPVSQISIEIGKLLLQNKDEISKVRQQIIDNRQDIYEKLREYREKGYISKVYKSNTNFLLFSFKAEERMKECYDFLLKNEVSVRNVSSKYLKNSLRVTATNDKETAIFLNTINEFFNGHNNE